MDFLSGPWVRIGTVVVAYWLGWFQQPIKWTLKKFWGYELGRCRHCGRKR